MKLETAQRYAAEVAKRVRGVNGVLATPLCDSEAVRIRRIYVFGSTVKGSQHPNDLDLLIDIDECGRRFGWEQARVDKRYYRSCGIRCAPSSVEYALKWLTRGMKKVSRHVARAEGIKIDVKVEIYPRMRLSV